MNLSQLKTQWLPIGPVKKISSRPQRFLLLGIPLVIFRVKEKIVALQDFCPHRGAPLSAGKLNGEVLQCAYHGWRFNTSGDCIDVPGLAKANCTNKRVPAYPTQIHLGLVFVCLEKNEDTLPLYEIPALQTERYHLHLLQLKLEGDVLNILENVLDATHTHFVHAGLLRHDDQRQPVTATLNVNKVSAEIRYDNESKQSGWISSLFEKNRQFSIGRFHLPLIAELEYHGHQHLTVAFTFFLSPMTSTDEHQVFFLISYRKNWLPGWIKKLFFLPFVKLALKQDKAILKKQAENRSYFPDSRFKSTELDIIRPHIERLLDGKAIDYQKVFKINL
ncbi:TPA: Rieske 2Fe-2S domain-containing protein [Legionella feeleii]